MDSNVFDSQDERSWYAFEARDSSKDTLLKLMATTRTLCGLVAAKCGGAAEEITVEGGPEVFMQVLSLQPWVSCRVMEHKEKESR